MKNIKKIVFIVFFCIALLFCIVSVGKPFIAPWPMSVEINNPEYATFDEDNHIKALTDNMQMRLSTTNAENKVAFVESYDGISTSDERYSLVTNYNNNVYVLHSMYDIKCGYISSEEILKVDPYTGTKKSIFKKNYDVIEDRVGEPNILYLKGNADGIYIVHKSFEKDNELDCDKINEDSSIENICRCSPSFSKNNIEYAVYNNNCKKMVFCTYYGSIYECDTNNNSILVYQSKLENVMNSPVITDDGEIFAVDKTYYNVYYIKDGKSSLAIDNVDAASLDFQYGRLIMCDSQSNSVMAYKINNQNHLELDETISSINYCLILVIYIVCVYISYIFIGILLLICIIKGLLYVRKSFNATKFAYLNMIILMIVVAVGVSVFYSMNLYNQAIDKRLSSLQVASLNTAKESKDYLNSVLDSSTNETEKNIIQENQIKKLSEEQFYNAVSGTSLFMYIFSTKNMVQDNETNKSYLIVSKDIAGINNEVGFDTKVSPGANQNSHIGSYTNNKGQYLGSLTPVYSDQGNLIGAVLAVCSARSVMIEQVQNGINLSLTLIIAFCVLLFFAFEFSSHYKTFKNTLAQKKNNSRNVPDCANYGARILNFFTDFVYGADFALCVLVTKDILSFQNIENPDILLGIPTSMYVLGAACGVFIGKFVVSRFTAKTIMTTFGICVIISELMTVYSVVCNDYIMFCVSKFLLSTVREVCCFSIDLIPYQTNDIQKQKKIINETTLASISSGAVSVMIAGLVSEYFGNSYIYVVCIIATLIYIICVLYYIPSKIKFYKKEKDSTNKRSSTKALLKFFLSPLMLSVFVLIFATVFVYQYSSIIFPLLADNVGLNKAYIGCITMIATCIVFVANTSLKRFFAKVDLRFLCGFSLFAMSIVMLCFGINSTIFWMVFALVIVIMGYRIYSSSFKLVWIPRANKLKIDTAPIYFVCIQATFVAKFIAPLVVTSLLFNGEIWSCCLVGFVSFVMFILFILLSRNNNT